MPPSNETSAETKEVLDPRETNERHEAISASFLGPRAENFDRFQEFITMVITGNRDLRRSYQPQDPDQITKEIQSSAAYGDRMKTLSEALVLIQKKFAEDSVPFWSPRYNGHMTSDTSMPATLGYLSTMLWNPNNVTGEASRISADIEAFVGLQLSRMLGYKIKPTDSPLAWGHITSGGTVANLESLWAARNLKFYPLSFRSAIDNEEDLKSVAAKFQVETCEGPMKLFKDLSPWEMLNLKIHTILEIPERVKDEHGIPTARLDELMGKYIIQNVGKDVIERKYDVKPIQFMVCSTRHYSWPKSADITGIGVTNMFNVPVDNRGRLRPDELKKQLEMLLAAKQAVYTVVAIAGSTEEAAVDPIEEIIKIRKEFQERGMSFVVHVDGAWGGYFRNMVRPLHKRNFHAPGNPDYVGSLPLRDAVEISLRAIGQADSVTVDPHKSGYIPYPAGSLCYRDGRMRFLVTWTGPYLAAGEVSSIGAFGVEGSKPGAAGVAVFLSHHVIGLGKDGYGALLSGALFTASRMSAYWATMETSKFVVVPFNMLTSEDDVNVKRYASTSEVIAQRKEISDIIPRSNWDLRHDNAALELLRSIGSDLIINCFTCNFKTSDNEWNKDVEEANYLNKRIASRLTVPASGGSSSDPISKRRFFISSTTFEGTQYRDCATSYKTRLGLVGDTDLFVLRSVVMSPFVTTQGLLKELMEEFQKVAEEEAEICRKRNDEKRRVPHSFLIHAGKKIYFIHQHMFHIPTHREQFIFTAEISGTDATAYEDLVRTGKGQLYVSTKGAVSLSEIIKNSSFEGVLSMHDGNEKHTWDVDIKNIAVVKRRPLHSRARDLGYPEFLPFYLYGTTTEMHIDHMLLRAPSIQISADHVETTLDNQLSPEDLESGPILCITNVRESWAKPEEYRLLFKHGTTFEISVYRDPNGPCAEGPGLAKVDAKNLLAKGTMVLKGNVFISDEVNQGPYDHKDSDCMPVIAPFHGPTVTPKSREGPSLVSGGILADLGYADWFAE